MRRIAMTVAVTALASVGAARLLAEPQIELDRIVTAVNNRIITESDVRQARTLHLVDDVSSDDAVRRALEERILVLGEMSRAPAVVVGDADVAARRAAWEARVGGGARAGTLVSEAGLSDAALDTWLRDDARIQAYLARQFSVVPDAERGRATAEWILRLRQRAGLK